MNLNPTRQLAYVTGVYLGDGCVCYSPKYGKPYFCLNAVDRDFVEHTAECLAFTTGKRWTVFEDTWQRKAGKSPMYKVVAYGKEFAGWLRDQCHGKQKLPGWIKSGCPEHQRSLIAGVMDSQGSVWESRSKGPNGEEKVQTMIAVYTAAPWLKDFCRVLEDLGVVLLTRTAKTACKWNEYTRPVYRQNIQTRSFVLSGCYFAMRRKQEKLETYASSVLSWNPQRLYAARQKNSFSCRRESPRLVATSG